MIPTELRELYRAGRVIPFVGAGVSRSVTWGKSQRGLLWSEFVDQAAKILGHAEPDLLRVRGTDLQILEYYDVKKGGNWAEVTNWFGQYMSPDEDALKNSKIHKALSNLTASTLFYTTNFDDFLERSLKLHGRIVNVIVEESDIAIDKKTTEVVKFHGDINHPHRMVISEKHYEKRISLSDMLDYRFRSDLLNRVVLFMGYSFRDPNVAYLLRLFNKEHGEKLRDYKSARRAYIVIPNPSNFERMLYEERNIGLLSIDDELDLTDGYVKLLADLAA